MKTEMEAEKLWTGSANLWFVMECASSPIRAGVSLFEFSLRASLTQALARIMLSLKRSNIHFQLVHLLHYFEMEHLRPYPYPNERWMGSKNSGSKKNKLKNGRYYRISEHLTSSLSSPPFSLSTESARSPSSPSASLLTILRRASAPQLSNFASRCKRA